METGKRAGENRENSAAYGRNRRSDETSGRSVRAAVRYSDGGLAGIIGHLGQTGTGKTYAAIQKLARARRVIFFDTVCNTYGRGPRKNPLPDYIHLFGLPDFVAYMRQHLRGDFHVVFHPGSGSIKVEGRKTARATYEFEKVCEYVYRIGNVVFMIDEVWRFTRPNFMPAALEDLVFTGRHPGVTLLYTSQRPNRTATSLLSQTAEFSVFRITQYHDLKALATQLDPAALAQVPRLPDRVCIERNERHEWLRVVS
jgi:hypothetical protein